MGPRRITIRLIEGVDCRANMPLGSKARHGLCFVCDLRCTAQAYEEPRHQGYGAQLHQKKKPSVILTPK